MRGIDVLADEILKSGIKKTTKEAYEYAKFLKNYAKSTYYNLHKNK